MAIDVSAAVKLAAPERLPVFQLTACVYLGRRSYRKKSGGVYYRHGVLFQFWRTKDDGSTIPMSGVVSFDSRDFRAVADAVEIEGLPDNLRDVKNPEAVIYLINGEVRSLRPGLRLRCTLGHGHMKVHQASPAKPKRDIGVDAELSKLSLDIIERWKEFRDDGN